MRTPGVTLRSVTPITTCPLPVSYQLAPYSPPIDLELRRGLARLLQDVYPSWNWEEVAVRDTFNSDPTVLKVWIIYDGEEFAACCAARAIERDESDSIDVHWISVGDRWKLQGIGSHLMSELWRWAHEHGKSVVYAYSETYTKGVQDFYERLGFHEVPSRI